MRQLRICCASADTAVFTVERVYEHIGSPACRNCGGVVAQKVIKVFFAVDFADKGRIAQKPAEVCGKATRNRVKGAKSVFNFILTGLSKKIILAEIVHQMVKGDVIVDVIFVYRI